MCPLFQENDRCFIRRTNATVHRGCLTNFTPCVDNDSCYLCSGHGCNGIVGNSTDIPEFNFANKNAISILLLTFVTIFTIFKF